MLGDMDRALSICFPQGYARSSGRESCVQICPCEPGLRHNALETHFLERSFLNSRSFSKNKVHDHVAELLRRERPVSVVPTVWMMGGGPRTYPGGVRKWQWKRRQWKNERELEKERFKRERNFLETRRRQELKEASPMIALTLDGPVKSSALGEMIVPGHRQANLLDPSSGPREAERNNSMAVVANSAYPMEGRQVSGIGQEGWTGSRKEVAEQIQKVREMVRNKYRQLVGPIGNETMSSFGELSLSSLSLKALSMILSIRNMTPLQEASLPIILNGWDLLARTEGSDEYITASLLLAIEEILRRGQELPSSGIARMQQQMTVSGRSPVTVLLVCPTQERAAFVASEAKLLSMFHPAVRVQVVKGGNDIKKETRRLRSLPCEIVVATPGRLLEHLQSSPEFRGQLSDLRLLILDEVQRLLDMGYRRTLERISRLVSRSWQTLLWSSSQSDEVLSLSQTLLKKNHKVINFRGADEDEVVHSTVRQGFVIVPIELRLALIYSLLKVHVEQEPNYKVVVFCQTVRTTTFTAELFKIAGFRTCEVHMRKNEKHRERVAAEFRTAQGGVILFTCGASVWGVANPDITLILQIGPPSGQEQYVQRVTSNGQETMKRECILLLMPHEQPFLKELSTCPLSELTWPTIDSVIDAQVQKAVQQVDIHTRTKAYLAWLRYLITRTTTKTGKREATQLATVYSTVLGFNSPPQLNPRTVKALGLEEL